MMAERVKSSPLPLVTAVFVMIPPTVWLTVAPNVRVMTSKGSTRPDQVMTPLV